ncbi:MAG: hypothetical protein E6J42_12100 [Chloroflexi bacterium]|nr:MAG: hypothetical protein E6J42_12100 [Chloroflexota bacterium]
MKARIPREMMESLSGSGFQVIVYGREDDPEVRRLVGETNGMALQDPERSIRLRTRKIALLRQSSEESREFADFVSRFVAYNIGHIYELRVINTLPRSTADGHRRGHARNGG